MSGETSHALLCHPDTPPEAVRAVSARVCRAERDALVLVFMIEGDIERLRVPESGERRMVHGLWKHTCCEAFLRLPGADAYHELNLASSGEWAAYAFKRYRDGVSNVDESLAPTISLRREPGRVDVEASVDLTPLSALYPEQPLRVALAAVIEEHDGNLSYWALHHPPGPPDFHHPEAFVLCV